MNSSPVFDTLWTNATLATMAGTEPYGLLEGGAVGVIGEQIAWVGPAADLSPAVVDAAGAVHDCAGALVTPGLIDCHTHLVYAGDRAREFELRLNGASYADIARAGGGIVSTVKATRAATAQELTAQTLPRLQSLLDEGVTTIEIKSGYGLDRANEIKMLQVARSLTQHNVTVRTTFLGAHALPPEYRDRADDYIDLVCNDMLPAVAAAGLADAVDAFCENIGFTPAQVERVFAAAAAHGLPIKLHAEQLSDLRGAALAASLGALSADHLEYLAPADVAILKRHNTVAVLLPGAFYCLRETRLPPIGALREHGVPIALATDSNPGSSPVTSLLLMLSMGCTLFGLTPHEALAGVTRHAAAALGLQQTLGTIETGKRADLVLWDARMPAELCYRVGANPCRAVLFGGHPR